MSGISTRPRVPKTYSTERWSTSTPSTQWSRPFCLTIMAGSVQALLDVELTSIDDVLAELKADAAIRVLAEALAWPQIALALLSGH